MFQKDMMAVAGLEKYDFYRSLFVILKDTSLEVVRKPRIIRLAEKKLYAKSTYNTGQYEYYMYS